MNFLVNCFRFDPSLEPSNQPASKRSAQQSGVIAIEVIGSENADVFELTVGKL